jgi:hypothetical protein
MQWAHVEGNKTMDLATISTGIVAISGKDSQKTWKNEWGKGWARRIASVKWSRMSMTGRGISPKTNDKVGQYVKFGVAMISDIEKTTESCKTVQQGGSLSGRGPGYVHSGYPGPPATNV